MREGDGCRPPPLLYHPPNLGMTAHVVGKGACRLSFVITCEWWFAVKPFLTGIISRVLTPIVLTPVPVFSGLRNLIYFTTSRFLQAHSRISVMYLLAFG